MKLQKQFPRFVCGSSHTWNFFLFRGGVKLWSVQTWGFHEFRSLWDGPSFFKEMSLQPHEWPIKLQNGLSGPFMLGA